jgi:hypothetical protein
MPQESNQNYTGSEKDSSSDDESSDEEEGVLGAKSLTGLGGIGNSKTVMTSIEGKKQKKKKKDVSKSMANMKLKKKKKPKGETPIMGEHKEHKVNCAAWGCQCQVKQEKKPKPPKKEFVAIA